MIDICDKLETIQGDLVQTLPFDRVVRGTDA